MDIREKRRLRIKQEQTKPKIHKVYGLLDPRNPNEVRYIGCTTRRLIERLQHHIDGDNSRHRTDLRTLWLKSLKDEGVRPVIFLIEEVPQGEDWEEYETYYIHKYRQTDKILNISNGGKGQKGCKVTEEAKKKISQANKGHGCSEETRRKIGLTSLGRTHSEETKKKMSEAHKRRCATKVEKTGDYQ